MLEWRHNEDEGRWELGHKDIDRNSFIVVGSVADEMIADEFDPEGLTLLVLSSFGSVPPPLEKFLPERT